MPTNKTVLVVTGEKERKIFQDLHYGFCEIFRRNGFGILFVNPSSQTTVERCVSANPRFIFISDSVDGDPRFKNLCEVIKRRCSESNIHSFENLNEVNVAYLEHQFSGQEVAK